MTSTSRIPQHVAPYVENVPKDSLTLLTSTLSNSVNWLTVRYVCAAFVNDAVKDGPQRETGDGAANSSGDIGVVLVSWMKDWEFWRAEARRSCGVDIASLAQKKKFVFVDGLSSSFPMVKSTAATPSAPNLQSTVSNAQAGRAPLPTRGPPSTTGRTTAPTFSEVPSRQADSFTRTTSLGFTDVQKSIEAAVASLTTDTALVILDAPDILLALQEPTTNGTSASTSSALQSLVLSLRLHPRVHATIVSLSADIVPLPSASRSEHYIPTSLETESQAFLFGLAHTADLVINARGLDTGAAGDVGGVLRVTVPGVDGDEEDDVRSKKWKEQELLYLVKTDGSAKVWERGAGVGVG